MEKLKLEIAEQNLEKILDMECRLIPLLLEMRWRGVRVDEEKADSVSKALSLQEQKIMVEIKRQYGDEVNLWANASLQSILKRIKYGFLEQQKVCLVFKKTG